MNNCQCTIVFSIHNFQQFCYTQDQYTMQPFCTLYFTP